MRKRFPWIGRGIRSGTFSARDATANPRLVTPAVSRAAASLGVAVLQDCRVTAIERRHGTFSVRTDTGQLIEAGHVINSAGAWGAQIAEFFGETAPLFPAGPPQFVTEPVPYFIRASIQAVDGAVNFRQIPRGNVIVSSTPRTATDPVTPHAPVPPFKTLKAFLAMAEAAPSLRNAQIIRVWSGVEGYLPDMLPVIGPSATTPGVFHAFGCSGHGFQIGPGVGLCLAEMIVDGAAPIPLESFRIERFYAPVQQSEKIQREFDVKR